LFEEASAVAQKFSAVKTIREPAQDVKVFHETDVVVVGGGPGGVGAAISAARTGAKTVLVERYGHLGGMATGGQVLMVPQVFAGIEPWKLVGVCQEWVDRCEPLDGCLHPQKDEVGSTDPEIIKRWALRTFGMIADRMRYSVYFDQEMLKCVLNDLIEEAGVKLLLHSWAGRAIVAKNKVKGVIFESKSGRLAILGKVVIDTTGDGDLFASAGAAFDDTVDPKLRSSQLALVFRVANVDVQKFTKFRMEQPEKHKELKEKMDAIWSDEFKAALNPGIMNPYHLVPQATPRPDVIWVNNWIKGRSPTNVEDLTWVEVNMRKAMRIWHKFVKANMPGYDKSFIMDTASQFGTRGSRRLIGEYTITKDDLFSPRVHEDTVVMFGRMARPGEKPAVVCFPYRALVPKEVDGFLTAGRSFSSDPFANNMANLIPHCAATGQAAGTAAALAVKAGVEPRKVDYKALQKALKAQGFPMPSGK
jgi:hypothetical protein